MSSRPTVFVTSYSRWPVTLYKNWPNFSLILWSYYCWFFSCVLFIHLRVAIYCLEVVPCTCMSRHVLVIHEPYSQLRYIGDIFLFLHLFFLTAFFHNPNLNHVNPLLSFEFHWSVGISLSRSCSCSSMTLDIYFLSFFSPFDCPLACTMITLYCASNWILPC